MNSVANKFAAFIIDRGKHSEFVFNTTDGSNTLVRHDLPNPVFADERGETIYRVPADAMVFSSGLVVGGHKVEMILCVVDHSGMTFAIDNSEVTYKIPVIPPATLHTEVTPEHYRFAYQALFGFDGEKLNTAVFHRTNPNREGKPAVESDPAFNTLRNLVYGENVDAQSTAMDSVGISFVAVRTLSESGLPHPVMWLNGNFLPGAGEDSDEVLTDLNTLVNSHLFDRYSKCLLGQARGFCPHLLY